MKTHPTSIQIHYLVMTQVIVDKGWENFGQELSIRNKVRSREMTRKHRWGRKMKHCHDGLSTHYKKPPPRPCAQVGSE